MVVTENKTRTVLSAKMKKLRTELLENEIDFDSFYNFFIKDFPEFNDDFSKKCISAVWYGRSSGAFLVGYAENLLKSIKSNSDEF